MRRYRRPQKFREQGRLEEILKKSEFAPAWRILRTVIFPLAIVYLIISQTWGNEERRDDILSTFVAIRYSAEHLPQFMLAGLEVHGLPDRIVDDIEAAINITFPISIFHIDEEMLRADISKIKEIENFSIEPRGGGNLVITARQSIPVAIWKRSSRYFLMSASGKIVKNAFHSSDEPDLILIAGDGADRAAHEIPFLKKALKPLGNRVQGLVRVGERRWDVAMHSGLLIMLPEADPIGAISRVVTWDTEHAITQRRLSRIDMRLPKTPSFRIISEEDAFLFTDSF
jgi:cell division protein FtsQ